MKRLNNVLLVTLTLAFAAGCDAEPTAEPLVVELPPLDRSAVTVSGMSSGAALAQQLHIARSDLFSGSAVIAGVPYGCSEGELGLALGRCIGKEEGPVPVQGLLASIDTAAEAGLIANPAGLADDRAWVFHGALDQAIGKKVSDATLAVYREFLPIDATTYIEDVDAAHLFPSLNAGVDCSSSASPWIGACGYDGAGELLSFLYPGLNPPSEAQRGLSPALEVVTLPGAGKSGLADEALVFTPSACPANGCRLHLVLHGCMQSREMLGDVFAESSGYLPWAEANGIVLAFPQVRPQPRNPLGCWDWWGYTGDNFLFRDGPQMSVLADWLNSMLDR